ARPAEIDSLNGGGAIGVLLRRNLVLGASLAFRRELLEAALPFGDGWVHDAWLAVVATALDPNGVRVIEHPLLDYRQHGSNLIGARRRSLGGTLARLREPRTGRNERLLVAAASLVDRVATLEAAPGVLDATREK